MKTVTMNIRVDETLRAQFVRTAEQLDLSAAQLIRGFMRDVVARHSDPATAAPQPRITESERSKRMEGYEFAKANVGLEGYELPPEHEKIAMKFINGEIEWNEFMEKSVTP
jgi:antitoxin component of RelBE/YafQ-DinJ toxin-antitoxin module